MMSATGCNLYDKTMHKEIYFLLNFFNKYEISSCNTAKTRMAKFNLVAQNSLDLIMQASQRRYGNQKWLRIASAIGGSVIGATIVSQLGFGKIRNPQNIFRKVSDDGNK